MTGISITAVAGLPEVMPGADLAALVEAAEPDLRDGDILVVTSKVISKAEGRLVRADREQAIDAESVRLVARRGQMRIVQTRHGLVLAAAGVDNSNTPPGTVALLPEDPDASARRLRKDLRPAGRPHRGHHHRYPGQAVAYRTGRRRDRRRGPGPGPGPPRTDRFVREPARGHDGRGGR